MRWIIVDGIDGSGKNTVAHLIKDYYEIRGMKVGLFPHPSTRWLGRLARRSLESEGKIAEILSGIFFMLDVLRSLDLLRRVSSSYHVVIFVRYVMGTAYLPRSLYPWGYRFFIKLLPVPPRLMLVDVDPEVACRRIRNRTKAMEVFENLPSLTKIRSRMIELSDGNWSLVDNNQSKQSTMEQVQRTIREWDERLGEGRKHWPFD